MTTHIDFNEHFVEARLVRRRVSIYTGSRLAGYGEIERVLIICTPTKDSKPISREWPMGTNLEYALKMMLTQGDDNGR